MGLLFFPPAGDLIYLIQVRMGWPKLLSSDHRSTRRFVGWIGWSGGVIFIAGYLGVAFGLYTGWSGPAATRVSAWLPVPLAVVAGRPVWFNQYLVQRQAMTKYRDYAAKASQPTSASAALTDITENALTKIIRDTGTFDLLGRFRLTVRPADVDQAFTAQLTQSGNQPQIVRAIDTMYGWTPDEFKELVIRPVVAREKLREKLSFDDRLNAGRRRQAEAVMAVVQTANQPFEELAKVYSEDAYAAQGGDLGWVIRGQQVQEIDEVAFNLEIGQFSELIHTKYGWHIIQVVEKKEVDNQTQVKLREIFISAPDVDEYITRHLSGRVLLLSGGYRWDEKNGRVVSAQ